MGKKEPKEEKQKIVKELRKADYKKLCTKSTKKVMDDKLILELYDVLLIHECKILKENEKKSDFHKELEKEGFLLSNNNTKKTKELYTQGGKGTRWYIKFDCNLESFDYDIFIIKGDNYLEAMAKHVRHAFAHGHFAKDEEYYIFGDFWKFPEKPTMLACLKEDKLKKMLNLIKKYAAITKND